MALSVGTIVIGRNEGERLRACLASLLGSRPHSAVSAIRSPLSDLHCPTSALSLVVYVDSGSTDGSVELARSVGAEVVELNMSRPFSAARGRNEGVARLREIAPEVGYVQFIDGDCTLAEGWLAAAGAYLDEHCTVAVVCGHLMERHRNATIYNRLCHLEWQKIPGEISAAGGIFMVRVACFAEAGGFNPTVIAAEDDELCLRIRRAGGKVVFLDHAMASHDAAMTQFGQWWKRAVRSGYAYAQGAFMHGGSAERHFVRQYQSLWFWGLFLPILALGAAWWTRGLSLALLGGHPLLAFRVYRYGRSRGWSDSDSRLYAFFVVLAKFPGIMGVVRFHYRRLTRTQQQIIEYKTAATAS